MGAMGCIATMATLAPTTVGLVLAAAICSALGQLLYCIHYNR